MRAQAHGRHLSGDNTSWSVGDARRNLAARFQAAGIASAALDARFLVEDVVGQGQAPDPTQPATPAVLETLERFAQRRLAGEPVWRILGEREFWGLTFRLSPATLEPRPDSETIVEAALDALGGRRQDALRILDLGTGTGCLLIALLSECQQARGLGIDLSEEACAKAAGNAQRNGVGDRSDFRQGDWVSGLDQRFDLVVSNPPYIPAGDIAGLDIGVRNYDPPRALDGGADGLDAYRALAAGIPHVLAETGLVVLEIGAGQEADVTALMTRAGLVHRATRHDLGGHARALVFTT